MHGLSLIFCLLYHFYQGKAYANFKFPLLNKKKPLYFYTSLSYANTMEVLEVVQVEVFCQYDIVLRAASRKDTFFIVWEGTCMEQMPNGEDISHYSEESQEHNLSIWHAGDWTGPKSLQPECCLSGECFHRGPAKNIIAISASGAKVNLNQVKVT